MNRTDLSKPLVLLASALLAACSGEVTESGDGLATLADRAATVIRDELATENLALGRGRDGLPRAELSPQGDLIIDGKTVPMTPEQRELALAYRARLANVAESGARVGLEGAALAGKAMKEAAKAALSGDAADVEARIEAEAESIRAAANTLCGQLPALYAAQQELAAALPEFAPYATMEQKDYTDCHDEVAKS
jgi:hypothetical protein